MSAWDQAVSEWIEWLCTPLRMVLRPLGFQPDGIQLFMLLCGVFIVAFLYNTSIGPWVLLRGRTRARGIVTALDESDTSVYATIRFRDRTGREHEVSTSSPARQRMVGGPVEIAYDPRNPRRIRELGQPGQDILSAICFYGGAVLCFALGFGLLPINSGGS